MSELKHAYLFDQEKREKLLPSRQILLNFGIGREQIIADLGCRFGHFGFGHFALRAAEMIGPTGKIKAVDIEPERMGILRQRAKEQGSINLGIEETEDIIADLDQALDV